MLFTEEDRLAGKPAEELKTARESGRADDERWHVRRDGVKIFCSGITTPLGDGTLGFAKIARDATVKQLRDAGREADLADERSNSGRLQELSAMKDEFLAVVSHELKNPLSAIQMNVQLLARLPSSAQDPRAVHSAKAIMTAVSSQAQIINDLLELSRANMGKITLAPIQLDLADLARNIIESVRPDIEAKGQSLTEEVMPAKIFGDPVRIEQIVWNLVTNAVKFTPEGGSVRVTVSLEQDKARLTVEDSGIGLDPSHLTQIFEMFKQVESATIRNKTGLGIGLALVKQLAELHGGHVNAESEGLGQGTRFSVWLPLVSGDVPGRGLEALSVLVVDDEPDALASLGALLETEGVRATLARSAEQALELPRHQRFDAVVSDIAMPANDDLALIALSGMARGVDRARATEAGFDALIGKPLDLEALRFEIIQALNKRSALGPSR